MPPGASTVAALAKGALRRLAQNQLEPTPENFAKAYAEESGEAVKHAGPAWPALIARLVRNLERGGKQWTAARRKESLHRVLDSSRSDADRLAQRMQGLLQAWESDRPIDAAELPETPVELDPAPVAAAPATTPPGLWPGVAADLNSAVRDALPIDDARAGELAARLAALAESLSREGATPALAAATSAATADAQRWFGQRHELVRQLGALCSELTQGLADLAEDDSWAHGQCAGLRARLGEGMNVRALRAASALLSDTRARQGQVRLERQAARDALKQLLADMLDEVGALGRQAGGFEVAVERHAAAIAQADSLESLAGIAQEMLADSRATRSAMHDSLQRLNDDHERARVLQAKVQDLETELRRMSEEASTDALTQVANRRGLELAFERERSQSERARSALAVGLIDIDNFKKLNDRLGHAAGDLALKSLAAAVRERLRPADHVARFGGEEFVVLLPDTSVEVASQTLTRLQRSLSSSLFLHEGEEVFVTFSAGVTLWRHGEDLQAAIERADEALYEAKRTGKNKTCQA